MFKNLLGDHVEFQWANEYMNYHCWEIGEWETTNRPAAKPEPKLEGLTLHLIL